MSAVAFPSGDGALPGSFLAPPTRNPRQWPLAYVGDPPVAVIRRARPEDLEAMVELMDQFTRVGLLLRRTPEQVRAMLDDFLVAVAPDALAGCAALRLYPSGIGEVSGLAVAEQYQNKGVGRRLVELLIDRAAALGLRRVFAFTLTPRVEFFHRLGFRTVPVAEFPEKIARDYDGCIERAAGKIAVARDLDRNP